MLLKVIWNNFFEIKKYPVEPWLAAAPQGIKISTF